MRKADPVTVDYFRFFLPDLLAESTVRTVAVEGKSCKSQLKKPNQLPSPLSLASFRQMLAQSRPRFPVPSTSENLGSSVLCGPTRWGGGGGGGGRGGGARVFHRHSGLFCQEAVNTHNTACSNPDFPLWAPLAGPALSVTSVSMDEWWYLLPSAFTVVPPYHH